MTDPVDVAAQLAAIIREQRPAGMTIDTWTKHAAHVAAVIAEQFDIKPRPKDCNCRADHGAAMWECPTHGLMGRLA